jgi:hypothetical protein
MVVTQILWDLLIAHCALVKSPRTLNPEDLVLSYLDLSWDFTSPINVYHIIIHMECYQVVIIMMTFRKASTCFIGALVSLYPAALSLF